MDDPGAALMLCRAEDRNGFALVLALLALMVLAGIVSAALAAGVGQVRAANRAGEVLARRTWAKGSVDAAIQDVRGWSRAVLGEAPVKIAGDTIGAYGSRRVLDLRVAPEFHLFIGEAKVGRGVPMRYVRVVWWMDPESRVGAHRAVAEGRNVTISSGAQVRADSLLEGLPGVPACGLSPVLGDAFGRGGVPAGGPLPEPPEWGSGDDAGDRGGLGLGRFGIAMLEESADRTLHSGGTPGPTCPGCWLGLVFGRGDSRLLERGAGVLVVDGDLVVSAGSSWTGLLIATGDVTLANGSHMAGLLRAGGSVVVESGASVEGSACAALEALRNATALARPLPLPGRSSAGPVVPAGGWQ